MITNKELRYLTFTFRYRSRKNLFESIYKECKYLCTFTIKGLIDDEISIQLVKNLIE